MGSAWPKAGRSRSARVVMAGVTAVISGLLMAACSSPPVSTPPATSAPGTSAPGTPAPGTSAAAAGPAATSRPGGVIALNAISTLRSLFNRADGRPRLVLIFSPT